MICYCYVAQSEVVRIVAVLPLLSSLSANSLFNSLIQSPGNDWSPADPVTYPSTARCFTLSSRSKRCFFKFIIDSSIEYEENSLTTTELLGIADSIILLTDYDLEMTTPLVDNVGERNLRMIATFGGSNPILVSMNRGEQRLNWRNVPKMWKSAVDNLDVCFSPLGGELKRVDSADHTLSTTLSETNRALRWRSQRSYLVSDQVSVEADGRVIVTGCLRGVPLYLHSLVHLSGGAGTARISRVKLAEDGSVLEVDRTLQDDMVMEAAADVLMGEQTWPSEQELMVGNNDTDEMEDDDEGNQMEDDEADEDGDDDESGDEDEDDDFMAGVKKLEMPTKSKKSGVQFPDEDDLMDDLDNLPGTKNKRNKGGEDGEDEEEEDDYVDTPIDQPARQRFARYRALQSFRTSPWHTSENLPPQYARIFQFDDIKGMQRRLAKKVEVLGKQQVEPFLASLRTSKGGSNGSITSGRSRAASIEENDGMMDDTMSIGDVSQTASIILPTLGDDKNYIRADQIISIELTEVSNEVRRSLEQQKFLTLFSLYQHETKLSVMHFTVKKVLDDTIKVRSKELLLFHTGFRSFWTKAIFSESNLNCDKHKMLQNIPIDGSFCCASAIAPVILTHQHSLPLMVYRYIAGGTWQLVATGSVMSIDPNRIMLKKIILTGNPIRVRKRTAVVKHMFYDPQVSIYFCDVSFYLFVHRNRM